MFKCMYCGFGIITRMHKRIVRHHAKRSKVKKEIECPKCRGRNVR